MDAQVTRPTSANSQTRNAGYATQPPLQRFLASCHEEFKADNSGNVADYIPELKRADPAHFGISARHHRRPRLRGRRQRRALHHPVGLEGVRVRAGAGDGRGGAGRGSDRRRAERRGLQFDPPHHRQPAVQSDGQCRRDRLLRTDPSRSRAPTPSSASGRRSAGSPAASSTSTTPCMHPKRITGDRNRAIAWLLRNYVGDPGRRRCRAGRLFPPVRGAGHRARSRGHGGDAGQPRHQSGDRRCRSSRPTSSRARFR